jgi:hypothetical protein
VGFRFTATPTSLSTSLSIYKCFCRIVSIIVINSMNIEPTFAESTSETVTAELRAQLNAAVATLPLAHCLNPSRDEVFKSKEAAFSRLQD